MLIKIRLQSQQKRLTVNTRTGRVCNGKFWSSLRNPLRKWNSLQAGEPVGLVGRENISTSASYLATPPLYSFLRPNPMTMPTIPSALNSETSMAQFVAA